jgi:SulP family sulfate permease
VDHKQLVFHLRATPFDARIVVATALAAVFVSVEFCIFIGVFLSFVLYIMRAAQVQFAELALKAGGEVRPRAADDPERGPLLLFNLEGECFFGAAVEIERHLETIDKTLTGDSRVVILFLQRARNPDAAFLNLLDKFQLRLQERRIVLVLCGVQPDLQKALHATGLDAQIGPENIVAETAGPDAGTEAAIRRGGAVLMAEPEREALAGAAHQS